MFYIGFHRKHTKNVLNHRKLSWETIEERHKAIQKAKQTLHAVKPKKKSANK
jgi:hypothetical protein